MADRFDNEAFYAALNSVRLSRQMTWKDVTQAVRVDATKLKHIGRGANPDVDGLAALLAWSKLKAEMFIRGADKGEAEPLAKITALLRADPQLTKQNAKLIESILFDTYNNLRGGRR